MFTWVPLIKERITNFSSFFFSFSSFSVERQIRSFKKIFFHLLLKFPTVKNYEHLIHLTQTTFNARCHRATGFSPHFLHCFDYAAGLHFRNILQEHKTHQREAFDKYNLLRESQKIKIHDKVRVRNNKPLIRKESAVFFPQTSETVYEVTDIKTQSLPYVYVLNGNYSKTFYGWNLVKVSPSILDINLRNPHDTTNKTKPSDSQQNKPVITVQNILQKTDSTKLRSGKVLTHAFDMTYDILKDGERQFVDKETLRLYKRLFGSQVLQYSEALLNDPQKSKHIV